MALRFNKRGLIKTLAGICAAAIVGGVFASPAKAADASNPLAWETNAAVLSFYNNGNRVVPMLPVIPTVGGAARTPHNPKPPAPPVFLNVGVGKIVYLKSHHRDPVMEFTVKLSRPSSQRVTFGFATSGSSLTADGEFQNTSGEATIHTGNTHFVVKVPLSTALADPSQSVILTLSDPTNADLGLAENDGVLFASVHSAHKH